MDKKITCIICPRSCTVYVDENGQTRGDANTCRKGFRYAQDEVRDPRRLFTSTVAVKGGCLARTPVRTSGPIKKDAWRKAGESVRCLSIHAPVAFYQVIVHDFIEKGIDLVATRSVSKAKACSRD